MVIKINTVDKITKSDLTSQVVKPLKHTLPR